jgi:hypothetical protein
MYVTERHCETQANKYSICNYEYVAIVTCKLIPHMFAGSLTKRLWVLRKFELNVMTTNAADRLTLHIPIRMGRDSHVGLETAYTY